MSRTARPTRPTVGVTSYQADPLYPKIVRAVGAILARGKVVAPVDVLIGMDILTPGELEDWRRGRTPYLERVIKGNLTRLSRLLRILRFHVHDLKLQPSWTDYRRWGKGSKQPLRFTKTGDHKVEEAYATHFVWPGKGPFHPPAPKRVVRADPARTLLREVRQFHDASLSGQYYESFGVNSKNYMKMSKGTVTFRLELYRLLDACVQAAQGARAVAREGFELLFTLLRRVDEDPDGVIFFADEAGVWQLGINWEVTLSAWFLCLAESASPEEFAREVDQVISDFSESHRPQHLLAASRVADAAQKRAMMALEASDC